MPRCNQALLIISDGWQVPADVHQKKKVREEMLMAVCVLEYWIV
jgi:hypothetical protein